jgi:hypothetical protein
MNHRILQNLLFNPVAIWAFVIVPAGAIYFTHRRFQEHCGETGMVRFLLAFLATLLTMSITTALVSAGFMILVFNVAKHSSLGIGIGSLIFGLISIPFDILFAALLSLPVGSRISRLFWGKPPSDF